MKDFFISYTGVDKEYAVWINWVLRKEGYSTFIQSDDFRTGNSFMDKMQEGLTEAERTIAVITPNYFKSDYTKAEWKASLAKDITGEEQPLILVMVKPTRLDGLLKPIIYIDLTDAVDGTEAKKRFLHDIKSKIDRSTKGNFASLTEPEYPIQEKQPPTNQTFSAVKNAELTSKRRPNYANYKLGQLDRNDQFDHLSKHIPKENVFNRGRAMGFIACGPSLEWPESVGHKLDYLISQRIRDPKFDPIVIRNNKQLEFDPGKPGDFIWEFLGDSLGIARVNKKESHLKKEIRLRLEQADKCHIFSRKVTTSEMKEQNFLVGVLAAWQEIKLKSHSPSHFLLLICESDFFKESSNDGIDASKTPQWHKQLDGFLKVSNLKNSLLPPFISPSLGEDIKEWLDSHIEVENDDTLMQAVSSKAKEIKNKKHPETKMPLLELREEFKEIFMNHPFR